MHEPVSDCIPYRDATYIYDGEVSPSHPLMSYLIGVLGSILQLVLIGQIGISITRIG